MSEKSLKDLTDEEMAELLQEIGIAFKVGPIEGRKERHCCGSMVDHEDISAKYSGFRSGFRSREDKD